tara:strand:- start:81 stop:533 length:453 start_codon:yes stop_codon:yes gene_type:complete
MAFFQAMQLVGVGLQFASAMDASRAARNQAAFNAYQQKLQLAQNKIQAREKANIRLSQYETAQASNRAFFSFLNRDIGSDRSLKAFFDKQAKTVGQDISAIQSQAKMEQSQIRSQIAQTEFEGRVKSRQYMMQGLTGVATGLYKYSVSKA